MNFNICKCCEAKDGKAGLLINGKCKMCHETEKTGNLTMFTYLSRTSEEIERMTRKLL